MEHYGFEISPSTARSVTLKQAQRAREELERQYEEPFRTLPEKGEDFIVAETDGTMICTIKAGSSKGKRPREWKEMRLVAAQSLDSSSAIYAAGFTNVADTGRRWGHCARDAGWGLNSQIHSVADGAPWIEIQSDETFGKQGTFLCDFYHVSEYLGAAAPTCREGRPDQWRKTQQRRLKRGAIDLVIDALQPNIEAPDIPDDLAPVRNANRYISNRTTSLDYPRALQLGLPIGSGMIESGHKHVLQSRLKRAGTAWLPEHADQIAHLRVIRANDKWSEFWN
jgi:hypothetical protein